MIAISSLPKLAYDIDCSCRWELTNGVIVDERDYVSSFLRSLRMVWHLSGGSAFFYGRTLGQKESPLTGCDGVILLDIGGSIKASFFETKWPRLHTAHARFDYFQGSPKHSHFSSQLQRQRKFLLANPRVHVFEMFLSEASPGTALVGADDWGSTIVDFQNTYKYDIARPKYLNGIWKKYDVTLLFIKCPTMNFLSLFKALISCTVGKPLLPENGAVRFLLPDVVNADQPKRRRVDPIYLPIPGELSVGAAREFCERLGLKYLFGISGSVEQDLSTEG